MIADGRGCAGGATHSPDGAMCGPLGGVQPGGQDEVAGVAGVGNDLLDGSSGCVLTLGRSVRSARDALVDELEGEVVAQLHGAEKQHHKDEMGGTKAHAWDVAVLWTVLPCYSKLVQNVVVS